ncbi:hypothetical protein BDB00DRAFT_109406 [Zychaea mexicana]|uniref:uncharacterized protein n=1 Tax=Zychaea mexicana TaxID=64656 RepID=UPI0022FF2CEB|nr:uncharacterized protein BDB00DRAFT_109406 [Zychaea mexicana]KAI9484883.1 hypothetical protein BDB00DRAFT_109406 [Zychaea mexicana]
MDNPALVVQVSFISSFVLLIAWYSLWHFGRRSSERERSFVVTLLGSFVMTSCSIPVLYHSYQAGFASLLVPGQMFDWTLVATCFFMTSLAMDLGIGALFYRSKINFLTGWVHHTVYLLILGWAIHCHLTRLFVAMCILELPTLCLSIGWVFPHLRHDYVFASLYVPTRIGFHAFMVVIAWPFKSEALAALLAIFPLHLYWFYGFICQQKRIRKESLSASNSIITTTDLKQPLLQATMSRQEEIVPAVSPALFSNGHSSRQHSSSAKTAVNNYSACSTMSGRIPNEPAEPFCNVPVGITT